jgi:hypothetical protein
MKIIPSLLQAVADTSGNGVPFAAMRSLIQDMESTSLAGQEKKAKVLEDFHAIGYGLTGWLVELIFGLAIAYVKSAAPLKA